HAAPLPSLATSPTRRSSDLAPADEAAGVHVDRGHRLGLVHDEIAARFEVHPPRERLLDLVLDTMQIEQRPLAAAVVGDAVDDGLDRKSTRLNSSHQIISYAV